MFKKIKDAIKDEVKLWKYALTPKFGDDIKIYINNAKKNPLRSLFSFLSGVAIVLLIGSFLFFLNDVSRVCEFNTPQDENLRETSFFILKIQDGNWFNGVTRIIDSCEYKKINNSGIYGDILINNSLEIDPFENDYVVKQGEVCDITCTYQPNRGWGEFMHFMGWMD